MGFPWRLRTLGAIAVLGAVLAPAAPAGAHPPGATFAIYQYEGLTLTPDRVRVTAVLNTAELVTSQDRKTVDADHDGTVTEAERIGYAPKACASLAAEFDVRVDGQRLAWTVPDGVYRYEDGTAGLPSARLTCHLEAPARLSAPAAVTIDNHHRTGRPGWRELTAVGEGVHLPGSLLPRTSVSDELRAIPPLDALSLDVRKATVRVEPGPEPSATPAPAAPAQPAAGASRAQRRLESLAAGPLTPLLAVLAVLVALLLGAGHALLPGHGKTVLAAYLAGRQGRPRDAVIVGGTVTVSHTGAVLVVGALISTGTAFAGELLLGWLGAVSGVLVVAVGAGMLVAAIRRRTHSHTHSHTGHHQHDDHHHHHDRPRSGLSLAGIGLAGGLIPSPSALVVLLASIGLGRAAFGVLLVVAYGLGMAGTLTLAGLLLIAVQRRIALARNRVAQILVRLTTTAPAAWPVITAALVLVVGAGLLARATVTLAVWPPL